MLLGLLCSFVFTRPLPVYYLYPFILFETEMHIPQWSLVSMKQKSLICFCRVVGTATLPQVGQYDILNIL